MTKLFHYLINQYPFYKKSRDLWTETQIEQILKGLQKYPEAFNPKSWTPKQLLKHALQESVDQVHYLVGLDEVIEDMEETISRQAVTIAALEERIAYLERVDLEIRPIGGLANFRPPYADLDD